MGWCQEFGLQITAGCDHAMIAAPDSCSCRECATVCHGRFSGCPMVWSASATPVLVGVTPLALGSGQARGLPAATNGKSATAGAPAVVDGADRDLRQVCAALTLEVQRLNQKIDQLADAAQQSGRDAVLRDVDARFAWLTDQLSERLVILGNEVAAIKRQFESSQD